MTLENLKALFPLEGYVSKEILETANKDSIFYCVGVRTLKEAIASKGIDTKEFDVVWGTDYGNIWHINGGLSCLYVETVEKINMMDIEEPTKVTFTLI